MKQRTRCRKCGKKLAKRKIRKTVFCNQAFERAYGINEPDYSNVSIINHNPDYVL